MANIYIYIKERPVYKKHLQSHQWTVQIEPQEDPQPKRSAKKEILRGAPNTTQKQNQKEKIHQRKWNQMTTTKSNTYPNRERRAKEHHGSWPGGEEVENPHPTPPTNQGTRPPEHPTDANTGWAAPPTRDKCKN